MGFLSALGTIAGIALAPETGGASLALSSAIGGGLDALGDSLIAGNAASKAAKTQAAGDTAAVALQQKMFDQQRTDKSAYLGGGTAANNELAYLMGITPNDPNAGPNETAAQTAAFNPMAGVDTSLGASGSLAKSFSAADFTADPGYQFSVDQGMQALQRSQAAKGGLMSGAALKDLSTYAQGTAAQEYGDVYNRYNTNQTNLFNRLSGVSASGQGMANTSGQAGTTAASNSTVPLQNAAQLNATGQTQMANAWSTGLGQLGTAVANSQQNGGLGPIIWN